MTNELQYKTHTFGDGAIHSMQADLDTSLSLRSLDVDQMQTTLECAADLSGFTQNSPLRFLRGGSQFELWFLQQVTRVGPKTWTLLAFSSLGRLTQMPHRGGIYTGAVTAGDLIREICGYENGQPAAGVTVYVGAAFENTLLYGWLPYVSPSGEDGAETGSARDNLLQVLFALNAAVRDDANGVLRIENLDAGVASVLGADRLYRDGAKVVYDPPVTAVTVLEHQWIAGSETETLFEGTTTAGQIIVFSEPMSSLDATGFTITESGANYAVLSSGSGTLTGRPYVHTTREITRAVTTAPVENTVRIEDATLVSITNSTDVASRVADYYAHRAHIEADAVIDFEDAGDVVSIYDPFDRVMRSACIEKIAPLTVSQTMKGRVSALVGFTPWQTVAFEDVRELLTGSGTWTVPEGVPENTEMQVVAIGRGEQGSSGGDGEAGVTHSIIDSGSFTRSVSAKAGGAGGAGGEGGQGGKIYRASVVISPGDTFAYNTMLDDAIFGSMTSGDGARSASGYTDPITGELYAAKGESGTPGGAGGAGGNYTGESGEDVETWLGGAGGTYRTGGGGATASTGEYGGGGGGGAAVGSNGNDASTTGLPRNNSGGAGADAVAPAQAAGYGTGGSGGNGGGGGGGTGAATVTAKGNGAWYDPSAAAGGKGSVGSYGAYGCIILYYRRPVNEQGGD